jgi:phage tail-like protein
VAAGETDSPAPKRLSGLTITTRDYLVVGTLDPAGLLVFDLHGGGPPERLAWPERIPFHPVDLAPRPGGGVWILDRAPDDAYAPRLWTLDRAFRVVSPVTPADEPGPAFRPKSDTASADASSTDAPGCFDTRLSLDLAYTLDVALGMPISLEALPDDTVLVAWRDAVPDPAVSRIQRLQPLSARDPERGLVDLSAVLSTYLDSGTWQVHDIGVEITRDDPRPVLGILYAVGPGGEQALSFDLRARSDDLQLVVREQYLPLRRFDGGGLASTPDGVYYDSRDRWLPMAAQPRMRFVSEGTVQTRVPFDGDVPRTTWHRVFLDACIPPDCHVQVESRSADSREQLRAESWQPEPAPYLRAAGSELPFDRPFGSDTPTGTGTWEVLLQQAGGRYLDLRLTLRGNGRATPRIQSLRVYAPRFSYLKEYLPDVYQNDDTSADFLERFLANPEGLFTALEGKIAAAEQLFDTRTVPSEYLDWLGRWLGAEFSSDLEPERRRLFLDHALPLYRRRGTMSGLLTLIDLALHPCPDASIFDRLTGVPEASGYDRRSDASSATGVRIVEAFRTRTQSPIRLGDVREERRPRLLPANASWKPADGLAALNRLFVRFLGEQIGRAHV